MRLPKFCTCGLQLISVDDIEEYSLLVGGRFAYGYCIANMIRWNSVLSV